jgi:hypothetical protein
MTDTEFTAFVSLIGAFGGVVLGAGLAWLVERNRRRFEARAQLSAARAEAWTRMAETATEAYSAIEHLVRRDQQFRWWDGGFIARFWLATQGYQRGLAARREMMRAFFDIRRLGPPAAVEHAARVVAAVEAAGEVAERPRSRQARNPQTWAGLLDGLVDAREALLEFPTEQLEGADKSRLAARRQQ